ncbi:MAG: hypothetical protein RBQ99_04600 [Trichlorobacter sp.]|jgi:hypothetical protein|nr:hypothetical protein [Trichlorobacter sp.]
MAEETKTETKATPAAGNEGQQAQKKQQGGQQKGRARYNEMKERRARFLERSKERLEEGNVDLIDVDTPEGRTLSTLSREIIKLMRNMDRRKYQMPFDKVKESLESFSKLKEVMEECIVAHCVLLNFDTSVGYLKNDVSKAIKAAKGADKEEVKPDTPVPPKPAVATPAAAPPVAAKPVAAQVA